MEEMYTSYKKCNEELVATKCGLAGFFCPFGMNVILRNKISLTS